jgi:hypothetical protein
MTFARLTPEQREQWADEGYVILEKVLSDGEIRRLTDVTDSVDRDSQKKGRDANAYLSVNGTINLDNAFLDLIDHPGHLGIVLELLGAHAALIACQLMVRPPLPEPGLRWHWDGTSPYSWPSVGGLMPLLQLKVGWFLTDVDKPNMGNFVVIPGSHVGRFPKGALEALLDDSLANFRADGMVEVDVPGARQVLVNAGDALLFHNSLWHAVAPNLSTVSRKNLYYVYAPPWIRQHDIPSPAVVAKSGPLRRQLLGALPGPTPSYVQVNDECSPLIRLFEGKAAKEVGVEQRAKQIRAILNGRMSR